MVRDSGSLAPGLASTLSSFQIDPGNGELVALPGTLYSNVSLSGASDLRFLLETGRFEHAQGSIDWSGADISLQTDPSDGKLVIDGTIEPFTIANDDFLQPLPLTAGNGIPVQHAIFMRGVVAVYEKIIRLENSTLWN